MFSVDQYLHSIKKNLEKESDLLAENLKEIFLRNFSADVELLEFTSAIEPSRFELSITMFSMNKEGNEVFYKENEPESFAGSMEILTDMEYYQVNEGQLDNFFDFYEENEEILVQQEQKIFTEWFHEGWRRANGASVNIPSYFLFPEEYKSYDLKKERWVEDEEKWS